MDEAGQGFEITPAGRFGNFMFTEGTCKEIGRS